MLREHKPPTIISSRLSSLHFLGKYSSETSGMILTFLISRRSVPEPVLTETTRIKPSGPGNVSMILPTGHCLGFALSSTRRTNAPTGQFLEARCHLTIRCNDKTYSLCHILGNSNGLDELPSSHRRYFSLQ